MTRADFYILGSGASRARFACTLAHKAWQQGHRPFLLAPDREEAAGLDDLLWTFQDISFLPHTLADDAGAGDVPVTIGWPGTGVAGNVLINLTGDVPDDAADFERVAEIVGADEAQRNQARRLYKHYREQGFEMHNHDMAGR